MSVSDPVADMLTKIRNASRAKLEKADIMPSKLKLEVIKILKNEGYIKNFKKITDKETGKSVIRVIMKYDESLNPIIHGLKSVSTPGRRVYTGYKKIPRVFNGYGTVIVSTSIGVTTGKKAVQNKVGGEILCTVW
jgi:small subunit ribosomal protein S8